MSRRWSPAQAVGAVPPAAGDAFLDSSLPIGPLVILAASPSVKHVGGVLAVEKSGCLR
jgi:hypothetical protein